jgi:thiaminase
MSFFERLKTAASAEWRAYTEHPFTNGLADGSLAESAFRHYLVQDYLFLIEFARAYALSVYKTPKLADIREAAAGLSAIPVVHILYNGQAENHEDAIGRLIGMLRIPKEDMFREHSALIRDAYEKRGREIAYREEDPTVDEEQQMPTRSAE